MSTQLKPGDYVRALDGSQAMLFAGFWVPDMEEYIGKTGVVEKIKEYPFGNVVHIKGFSYVWDERYLEKVNPQPLPKRILRTEGATIVFWEDGTKTVVKPMEGTQRSDYDAFTAALAKKIYGTNSAVCRIVAKTEVGEK